MNHLFRSFCFMLACALFLAGCASKRAATGSVSLENKQWKLISAQGKETTEANAYIEFEPNTGRLRGKGGCNGFGGAYTTSGSSIKMTGIISTKMACNHLAVENAFFTALNSADRYEIKDNKLFLYQGKTVLATLSL